MNMQNNEDIIVNRIEEPNIQMVLEEQEQKAQESEPKLEFEREPVLEPGLTLVQTVKKMRRVSDKKTKKKKRCVKGHRRNVKTHRCNIKCPEGYKRNATKKRCVKSK